MFKTLGFKLNEILQPDYWYFKPNIQNIICDKSMFQKDKLPNVLDDYDENLSEVENMKNNGYMRIFDCESLMFVKTY